jgi:hypothetical protein
MIFGRGWGTYLTATKRIRISGLAGEPFVVFQRTSSPEVFDRIIRVCNDNGFSPRLLSRTEQHEAGPRQR